MAQQPQQAGWRPECIADLLFLGYEREWLRQVRSQRCRARLGIRVSDFWKRCVSEVGLQIALLQHEGEVSKTAEKGLITKVLDAIFNF